MNSGAMCDRRNGLFSWQSAQDIFKHRLILLHFRKMANRGANFKNPTKNWNDSLAYCYRERLHSMRQHDTNHTLLVGLHGKAEQRYEMPN
jgi:hypothetical protein